MIGTNRPISMRNLSQTVNHFTRSLDRESSFFENLLFLLVLLLANLNSIAFHGLVRASLQQIPSLSISGISEWKFHGTFINKFSSKLPQHTCQGERAIAPILDRHSLPIRSNFIGQIRITFNVFAQSTLIAGIESTFQRHNRTDLPENYKENNKFMVHSSNRVLSRRCVSENSSDSWLEKRKRSTEMIRRFADDNRLCLRWHYHGSVGQHRCQSTQSHRWIFDLKLVLMISHARQLFTEWKPVPVWLARSNVINIYSLFFVRSIQRVGWLTHVYESNQTCHQNLKDDSMDLSIRQFQRPDCRCDWLFKIATPISMRNEFHKFTRGPHTSVSPFVLAIECIRA